MSAIPSFELITATGLVVLTWAFLGSVFIGLGLGVQRMFAVRTVNAEQCLLGFWVGYCLVIIFLQIWHLWFAITWQALALVVALGMGGLLWEGRNFSRWLWITLSKKWVPILVLFIAVLWIANLAS